MKTELHQLMQNIIKMNEFKDINFDIENLGTDIVVMMDRDHLLKFASILEKKGTSDFVLMDRRKKISIKTTAGLNVLRIEVLENENIEISMSSDEKLSIAHKLIEIADSPEGHDVPSHFHTDMHYLNNYQNDYDLIFQRKDRNFP